MKKRLLAAAVVGGAFLAGGLWRPAVSSGQAGSGESAASCAEGTWLLRLPDGRILHETIVAGRSGQEIQFHGDAQLSNPDPTLGGMFPDAVPNDRGFRGSAVRVGPELWEARVISSVVNVVDGVEAGIAYIIVGDAVGSFPDCDTQDFVLAQSFFLPEQDADGDGLPDNGEEPFLRVEGIPVTGVRF